MRLLASLGLSANSGNARTHIKGHAIRLGLDFGHLGAAVSQAPAAPLKPDLRHLRSAGLSIAAAWFTLCGRAISLPVEPATYDLVVSMPEGLSRVQVKTTTSGGRNGWQVTVSRRPYSSGNVAPRVPYDPDVIDYFFIVDGDLSMYLIPSRVIAGRVGILLRTYRDYTAGNASGLVGAAPATRGARPVAIATRGQA